MNVLKFFQGLFLVVFALVLSVGAFLTASAFQWASELESEEYDLSVLDSLDITATSQVFANDGSQIGTILPAIGNDIEIVNRIPVQLDEVSPAVLQAIIAYEDDEFFEHYGIDLPGIARATYEQFLGDEGRGGSTITTQVVKNYILDDIATVRSLERKAKEWMLAVQLERRLTKAEILQRYINVAYWGGQVYGLRAAAEAYFEKEPIDLTLAEGLYLARLIPAPNARYNDSFEETRASMRTVLNRMVDQNIISQAAADRAWRYDLQPKGWEISYDGEGNIASAEQGDERPSTRNTLSSSLDPQIIVAVRNELTKRLGQEAVFSRGGLKVYTTIDPQAQQAARAASLNAEAPEGAQLAIAGLDPQTGEILAMVGERLIAGQPQEEYNRALQARRQPGSSFKPFVVASAIEAVGWSQNTVLIDEKTVFEGANNGEPWEPGNHDDKFSGAHTLRYHLDQSRNIPMILALEAATPEVVAERATELGYNVRPSYSLALGSYVVTPVIHAAAYTSFANGGKKMNPYLIERVENAEGEVIYQAEPRGVQVWSPETAYIMLDMLYGNVNDTSPTALSHRAKIDGRWVGGKTGTTNDERDIWFTGVTPGMVAAVWIGYDDNRGIPESMPAELARENGDVGSSRQPIYIWKEFVEAALRNKSGVPTEFPVPDGIEFKNFNVDRGGPGSTRGAFLAGTQLRGAGEFDLKVNIPFDTCANRRATASTQRSCLEYRDLEPEEIARYVSQAPAPGLPSTSGATPSGAPLPNANPLGTNSGNSSAPTNPTNQTNPTNGLTTTPTPFPDPAPSPTPESEPLEPSSFN